MSDMLRYGWQVSGGLFLLFAVLVSSWIILTSAEDSIFSGNRLRTVVVVMTITATLCVHWFVSQPQTFRQNSRITLILSVILIQLMLMKLSSYMAGTFAPEGGFELISLPFVFAPMVVSLLMERQHGTFAVVYTSILGGMMVPSKSAFLFVIFSILCGFVAIYLTNQVRKRSRLVTAGIFAGIACGVLAFCLGQIQIPNLSANEDATWAMLGKQALTAIFVSTLTAIVVSGILPLIEGVFRITTDVSWLELADLNHPLLRQMTFEAPGTYHHSLVVATLAEAAAEVVGANAVMARVCAYFHDIGKLKKPGYFVENIGEGQNPHDDLTPTMSALIIVAHVKDGVDLAIKHNLKPEVIDVIQEHHGNSLIKYFHHRALEHQKTIRQLVVENKAREEDIPEVNADNFRYPGPKPRSRESAIVSLADAVESASRSLKKPTPKKIEELIDEIVKDRLLEGQLDRAKLTLADLYDIKESFNKTLRNMMHARIAYPAAEKEKVKTVTPVQPSTISVEETNIQSSTENPEQSKDSEELEDFATTTKKRGKAGDQSQKILDRVQACTPSAEDSADTVALADKDKVKEPNSKPPKSEVPEDTEQPTRVPTKNGKVGDQSQKILSLVQGGDGNENPAIPTKATN